MIQQMEEDEDHDDSDDDDNGAKENSTDMHVCSVKI